MLCSTTMAVGLLAVPWCRHFGSMKAYIYVYVEKYDIYGFSEAL